MVSLGLPLFLIYLSVTGSGLAKLAKKIYALLCCCLKNNNKNGSRINQPASPIIPNNLLCVNCQQMRNVNKLGSAKQTAVPMWLCILLVLCYITTGATIFCVYQEHWSFVDSFFFAFSVIWTIGLVENTENDGLFIMICTLYLLLGLALLAMCVHISYECSQSFGIHQKLAVCLYPESKPEAMTSSWVYNEAPS